MTGTIIGLTVTDHSGMIGTPNGSRVTFDAAEVLDDFETLALGQRVSFDFGRRYPDTWAARVMREPALPNGPRKPGAPPDLRYSGFDQALSKRSYRFRTADDGHLSREFIVSVDVTLFLECRVGLQEAPALCLRRLTADLASASDASCHQLGREDLMAYLAARNGAAERGKPKSRPGRRVTPRTAAAAAAGGQRPPALSFLRTYRTA